MRMMIIGGFLGSGKTTIVSQIVHSIIDAGGTAAIIENEMGQTGVDQQLVAEAGVKVTPLFGGCVCCQISGSLISAMVKIRDEIGPDWLIVETTGLAMMSGMMETLQRYGEKDIPLSLVTVVDAARWPVLIVGLRPLMENQVGGVDVVIVNKCDVAENIENTVSQIQALTPSTTVLTASATNSKPNELWAKIEPALN